jgi:hypothetical protein
VQIAAGTTSSAADAKKWSMARGHFALGTLSFHKLLYLFFSISTGVVEVWRPKFVRAMLRDLGFKAMCVSSPCMSIRPYRCRARDHQNHRVEDTRVTTDGQHITDNL